MNRTLSVGLTLSILAAASMLGGCSWFHKHDDYYAKARQTPLLEVPPDLDTPPASNTLTVPEASNPSATPTAAGTGATIDSAPPAAVISGAGLHVADSVDHTWQRVGLALERGQLGTISARDPTAHTYTLEVAGLRAVAASAAPSEHHWYSRILHPFGGDNKASAATTNAQPVSGHLTVTVSADGDGAKVDVAGPAGDSASAEAAQRVLQVLRDRLA